MPKHRKKAQKIDGRIKLDALPTRFRMPKANPRNLNLNQLEHQMKHITRAISRLRNARYWKDSAGHDETANDIMRHLGTCRDIAVTISGDVRDAINGK